MVVIFFLFSNFFFFFSSIYPGKSRRAEAPQRWHVAWPAAVRSLVRCVRASQKAAERECGAKDRLLVSNAKVRVWLIDCKEKHGLAAPGALQSNPPYITHMPRSPRNAMVAVCLDLCAFRGDSGVFAASLRRSGLNRSLYCCSPPSPATARPLRLACIKYLISAWGGKWLGSGRTVRTLLPSFYRNYFLRRCLLGRRYPTKLLRCVPFTLWYF